jgi:hypothetical protein
MKKNTIRSLFGSLAIAVTAALFTGCGGGDSAKVDVALDKLEQTCTKTSALMQKARTGDQAALAELQTVTKEYQDFAASVQSAGTMSAAQQKRYQEIIEKYTKSMQ